MALQQNIRIPAGINLNFKYPDFKLCTKNTEEILENAYIKVDNQNGNKTNVHLEVGIYTRKEGILVFSSVYNFVPNIEDSAPNFIKQGYEYLKTLDEYKDTIDC